MWWWDSNPLPRERESSMTATRPGLLPKNYLVSFFSTLLSKTFLSCFTLNSILSCEVL